ncbi:hypothetical protein C4572_01485 [Candidatus Parcubacteria bacterium]|nr:MAG: hypothetical protein C4572_01485 [Candidatus Parcubacteria bacterium]
MKILDVIPIAKGIPHQKLSYFTSKEVKPGALVAAPLNKKEIPAIVSAVFDAKESKISLKDTSFSIKPIKSVLSSNFLTPEFIEACKEIAHYYMSTQGAIIKDFVPQAVLETKIELKTGYPDKESASRSRRSEILLIQAPKEERLQRYRSIVREEFAKNNSVFFCLPTLSDMAVCAEELQRGIEKYVFMLNGKMPKKKMIETWIRASEEKHPVLIVATPSFLSIPRKDINAIIMDGENSPAYKNQKQPYADARKAAEIICKKLKARLVLGDELLRSETARKQETGEAMSSPAILRVASTAEQLLIDAKDNFENIKKTGAKKLISAPALVELADRALRVNGGEKIVIFANRRGHTPTTICQDCNRTILCPRCAVPLVLRKELSKGAAQVCHKCLNQVPAPDQCPYCKSWRLEGYGIGTQMVAEEMTGFFPETKIYELDSDTAPTDKTGKRIAESFYASGGILVGTEAIFSYLKKPVDRVIAISVDGLFSVPEFRINERVFRLLMKLKGLARKTFAIQTRFPELAIFDDVLRGNVSGFCKKEIEARKIFQYPPFKFLIKLTKEGKNENQLIKEVENIQNTVKDWQPVSYPAFIPKVRDLYRRHILIKLDPGSWPPKHPAQTQTENAATSNPEKLYQLLSSLPHGWKVDIEPDNLL